MTQGRPPAGSRSPAQGLRALPGGKTGGSVPGTCRGGKPEQRGSCLCSGTPSSLPQAGLSSEPSFDTNTAQHGSADGCDYENDPPAPYSLIHSERPFRGLVPS